KKHVVRIIRRILSSIIKNVFVFISCFHFPCDRPPTKIKSTLASISRSRISLRFALVGFTLPEGISQLQNCTQGVIVGQQSLLDGHP
ncbi:MAG: hypothetical protein P8X90_35115, partial [Desulfobacterales bacterium]